MTPTDASLDDLVDASGARAARWLAESARRRTRAERASRERFAGLLRDPGALAVTITLTDEVMRFASVAGAAATLRRCARRATVRGFGALNAAGLRVAAAASRVAPRATVSVVHAAVRSLTRDLILDASEPRLRRHALALARAGLATNVNVLGEAVLGEGEATDRLARVLEMIERPEVGYVSVKLSAVVSQLTTIDAEGSLRRVAERLRTIYRAAQRADVFVNLDMEEFRDLRLTVAAFTTVLGEEEFLDLPAGIVLQAYLPDSHAALEELLEWAARRHARAGAWVKIRLVKGANLAMEHAEAELHGWVAAPYPSKADVDASYARMLDVALRPRWAGAVRVGVASHNLFHVAWALEVAARRDVTDQVDVEMLEGMANAEALTIARDGQRVVLYTPVTRRNDFAAAVAYLVRRLDENTSPENYLRAAFHIADDPVTFEEQRRRFADSILDRHVLSVASRRHGPAPAPPATFANARDADPTDPGFAAELRHAFVDVAAPADVVLGEGTDLVEGVDPNAGGAPWYRYAVASAARVDEAVARAAAAAPSWEARGPRERRALLEAVAGEVERRRASAVAVMARDGGKTVAEADPEVSEAVDFLRYYARRGEELEGSSPLGVVLVVPPWNFPFAIPTGGIAAALAAGNAAIVKPAPEAVASTVVLARCFWDAGVPRDVLQVVATRDDDVGRRLVSHDGVDAVVLTGSFETAALFTSWKPDLHLLGETSGKNAMVVTASADVDLAVRDLVVSAFGHAGQKCSAASLGIVDEGLLARGSFLRQLRDAVTSLRVGAATDLSTTMGPLIRAPEAALSRALTRLDEGESWLVEPRELDGAGLSWSPGVKLGVAPGSWSHRHEWFGPVLGLMAAPDLATAVRWQNGVDYGLTAGIHSLDEAECEYWLEAVEAGNLYVNRPTTGAVVRRQPFGGWKRSSVGPTAKAGGPHYLECLRRWPGVSDPDAATAQVRAWWDGTGARSLDVSGLATERNLHRYRRPAHPFVVRVDESLSPLGAAYLTGIAATTGVAMSLSAAREVPGIGPGIDPVVESVDELVARVGESSRVRWLSGEAAPTTRLLDRGVTTDRRPLAQRGSVEAPRWLGEQSVALTHHRYGNVRAGPTPRVPGLGDEARAPGRRRGPC